jgi:3-deoxy-7-phosphoheptulonate synthase
MNQGKKLIILGPCSVESLEQMTKVTNLLCQLELPYLRTQLFKPRTNPESFQGLGVEGIPYLEKLKSIYPKIKFVMEVGSLEQLTLLAPHAHVLQIGARNMQNFELLKVVGKFLRPHHDFVLLKRGFASTFEEWMSSARYLIQSGVPKNKIILCERGSRSLTSPTGVQLDFLSALMAKDQGYQVIGDPSHGTKKSAFVIPMAKAILAAGLDGLMMECHPDPKNSVSDAAQALSLEETQTFIRSLDV